MRNLGMSGDTDDDADGDLDALDNVQDDEDEAADRDDVVMKHKCAACGAEHQVLAPKGYKLKRASLTESERGYAQIDDAATAVRAFEHVAHKRPVSLPW